MIMWKPTTDLQQEANAMHGSHALDEGETAMLLRELPNLAYRICYIGIMHGMYSNECILSNSKV